MRIFLWSFRTTIIPYFRFHIRYPDAGKWPRRHKVFSAVLCLEHPQCQNHVVCSSRIRVTTLEVFLIFIHSSVKARHAGWKSNQAKIFILYNLYNSFPLYYHLRIC